MTKYLFWFDDAYGFDRMFTFEGTEDEAIDKAFDLWADGCDCISVEEYGSEREIFNSTEFAKTYC